MTIFTALPADRPQGQDTAVGESGFIAARGANQDALPTPTIGETC